MELESCLPEGIGHLIERLRLVDEGEVLCSRLVVRGSTYGTSVVKEDVVLTGSVSCEKSRDQVVTYRRPHLYLTDDLTREVVAYRILLPWVDLKEPSKGADEPAPIRTLSKAIDSHRADLGLELPLLRLSREVSELEESLARRE